MGLQRSNCMLIKALFVRTFQGFFPSTQMPCGLEDSSGLYSLDTRNFAIISARSLPDSDPIFRQS